MVETGKRSQGQTGDRAQRAVPPPGAVRFTPANDNRPPRNRRILWTSIGLAVALAAIGLYGVMAYVVTRRTREIGIRMALGATRENVAALILREVARLAGIGLGIGLVAALAADRLLSSLLYGVRAADPLVFALAVLLLALVALVAGGLPARRAAGVDPMVALRYE